jgi:hypothetical protein
LWLRALANASPFSAVRLGVLPSAANPKVAVLAFAGGVEIGAAELGPLQTAAGLVEFALVATLTIAMPWLLYTALGERIVDPLIQIRGWLAAHDALIVTAVLALVGGLLVVEGLVTI